MSGGVCEQHCGSTRDCSCSIPVYSVHRRLNIQFGILSHSEIFWWRSYCGVRKGLEWGKSVLSVSKTKEIVVDFHRLSKSLELEDIERVQTYKCQVHLDNKLDWTLNTDTLYRRGQCQLFFFRRLRYFDVCSEILPMFYQPVVASVLFYAIVCWAGNMLNKNTRWLDKLVKKAGSVPGKRLDSLHFSLFIVLIVLLLISNCWRSLWWS